MAIQVRRGLLANYDKDKMLAGELAVTTDTESQNQQVFVAFAPGKSKRILTEDDNVVNTIQHIWTGVCDTHAGTETKIVTLDNPYGFALENGVTIAVYFTNPNRADVPKLNVNDTGAISVKFSTHITDYDMTEPYSRWGDGMKLFTYRDGAWMIAFGEKTDLAYTVLALSNKASLASPAFTGTPTAPTAAAGTNTTQLATTAFVTNAISGVAGAGYGVCQTAAATTTKAVTIRGLTVKKGTVIAVMFTEEAYGAFSLNVNDTTSTVYYNEVGYLPQGFITAGSTALFMYDDGYVFLGVNKVGKSQITATDLGSGVVELGLV